MAIEGSLVDMSVVDIVQLNCRSRNPALVELSRGDKEGTIYFDGGQIVHAIHDQEEGEEALYQLLGWQEGRFVIEKGVDSPDQSIQAPWTALLMEGMRRLDEARGLSDDGVGAASSFADVLQGLADRVDGLVAAYAIDLEEERVLDSLVPGEHFNSQKASDILPQMLKHVSDALNVMDAGRLEEIITATAEYRFITRPAEHAQTYVQIVIPAGGNIGAARMYLAAYLVTEEED